MLSAANLGRAAAASLGKEKAARESVRSPPPALRLGSCGTAAGAVVGPAPPAHSGDRAAGTSRPSGERLGAAACGAPQEGRTGDGAQGLPLGPGVSPPRPGPRPPVPHSESLAEARPARTGAERSVRGRGSDHATWPLSATSLPLALLAVRVAPHPNKVKTPKKKKILWFGAEALAACGFGRRV